MNGTTRRDGFLLPARSPGELPVYVGRQHRYCPKPRNYAVEGYDTETQDGYARIAATSEGWRRIDSIEDVLSFLSAKTARGRLNVFYNIAFDFEVLFKHEPRILKQLAAGSIAEYDGWRVKYLPKKELCLRSPSKHTTRFYDVAQFYQSSLAKAAHDYLGLEAHEFKGDRARLFEKHSIARIGEYCQHDAMLTQRLGERWMRALGSIDLRPPKLISAGYLSAFFAMQHADIPTAHSLPRRVARMYWQSYRGGWFDCYKRGSYTASSYDVKSAYPWALSQLPDQRHGVWHNEVGEPGRMGVVRCVITRCPRDFIPLSVPQGILRLYPLFDIAIETTLTLGEFLSYERDFGLEPLEAWEFRPDVRAAYPYAELVRKLYALKERSKGDDAAYNAVKKVINSLYGKTAQRTKHERAARAGSLFNPCYASETTARTRTLIYDRFKPYAERIISVNTDGVILEGSAPVGNGSELGELAAKHENERMLSVGCGVYQFEGERITARGFKGVRELCELCNTDSLKLAISYERPKHYKESIRQDRYDDIGVFKRVDYELDLRHDLKRLWLHPPHAARDLLSSRFASSPVPLSIARIKD